MRARRTAREVASPAAQDLRDPALGADKGAYIEGARPRMGLGRRPGGRGAVQYRRSGDERPEELGARRIFERLQAAAQRVHQTQPRRVVGLGALDLVFAYEVRDG